MKKLIRRVLCIVLICSMMFGSVIVIHAEEEKQSVDEIKKIMAEAALNWAETFQPETKYQIGEVIPIYNGNDVIASYYVTYLKSSSPNGYIVLTVQDEALEVLEFSFESKTDLYQQLKGGMDTQAKQIDEPKMYSVNPFEYFVKDQNGNYYGAGYVKLKENDWKEKAESYQNSLEIKQNSNRFLATENIIIASNVTDAGDPMSSSLSGYTIIEDGILSRHVGYSEPYIENLTGKYACAVVALTEIAAQKGILLNNSVADTFNSLWELTSTTEDRIENGIVYGGTYDYNQRKGMILYCNRQNKECFDTYKNSPSYDYIKEAIKNGMSGVLGYNYTKVGEDGKKESSGHAVSVIGYCSAKKNNVAKNFVKVYDGWNNNWCYFNLSDYTFNSYNYIQYNIY